MESTLMLIKPDAVARHVIGEILRRVEAEGFAIDALHLRHLTREEAQGFYRGHQGKAFFPELIEFMISGPMVAAVLVRQDAVAQLRRLVGETDSARAAPGTIRHTFGTDKQRNAVHASDAQDSAAREICFFFGDGC